MSWLENMAAEAAHLMADREEAETHRNRDRETQNCRERKGEVGIFPISLGKHAPESWLPATRATSERCHHLLIALG